MNKTVQALWSDVHGTDVEKRRDAYLQLMAMTEQPVDWAYTVWDQLLIDLREGDNHLRAIAAQLLCNLAKSDPDDRMEGAFAALIQATRDPRFVTARHTLQALWRTGLAGAPQRLRALDAYAMRFEDSVDERNCTLVRHDIQVALRALHDATQDPAIYKKAWSLIETETDLKYRKKYTAAWRGVPAK